MKKVILSLVISVALTGCGDNLFAKIDNSTTTTTTTTTGSSSNNSSGEQTSNEVLEVPSFPANSMGKLIVKCESDIAYFIMAYNCLKPDTKVGATVDSGTVVIDNRSTKAGTNGTIYYIEGHIERTGPITITGTVFAGGNNLPTNPAWVERCN